MRFLTHPPRTPDPAAVRAYLFTIATRLARDAWRHESWIGRWLHGERVEVVGDTAMAPDARYQTRDDVDRALRTLTARERALLWLAHVEQYDHREIGAILGVRPGSVRVLLHRARRRALANWGSS